jgi:ABC-type ATPase with predicted acetyltransferase domain
MGIQELFKITRIARHYDPKTGIFRINIAYKTKTYVTDRTVAVAEAFGLGIDNFQKHVIYDNLELKIGPRDIVYITGDSGSGKSVLLKKLEKILAPDTVNIKHVKIDRRKPLIDTVGKTLEEGLALLSLVGLNDAFLFVRRYSQLSDGQRYRYRIAKMIESGKQYWVMDEFCATLDRDTAKIVAFNTQKLARQQGKALLAATTHIDLFRDLKPSVHIHKGLGEAVKVKYYPNKINKRCSLTQEMRVEEGTREDYKKLAGFHYRNARLPMPLKIFALKHRAETVGVVVYSHAPAISFGRRQALGRTPTWQEITDELASISRVILHPKYRTIGLGTLLVRETLPLVNRRYIETMAVMAKYNPFFEKAGMKKIAERKPDKTIMQAVEKLQKLGFNPTLLPSEKANRALLNKMNKKQIREVKRVLLSVSSGFYKRIASKTQPFMKKSQFRKTLEKADIKKLARMLRILSILAQTKVYLFWEKPS